MNQNIIENFNQDSLVQIKHFNTKQDLLGTNVIYGKPLMSRNKKDEFYVGLTNVHNDEYKFFYFEKVNDNSSKLKYGDLVLIKHLKTQLYLSLNYEQKSEASKDAFVFLEDNPHKFVLQSDQFEHNNIQYDKEFDGTAFKIFSAQTMLYIGSNETPYIKNKLVTDLLEISGSTKPSSNSLWELQQVNVNTIPQFIPRQINNRLNFVLKNHTIIIRNYWTGFSLHSHNQQYKLSKKQEVTCFNNRDNNDLWIIDKIKTNNCSNYIDFQDEISLQHIETSNYLSCDLQNQTYSQQGQQAICNQNKKTALSIHTIDSMPIQQGVPFMIKYNNLYLSQTNYRAESKFGIQQECAFIKNATFMSYWMIEDC